MATKTGIAAFAALGILLLAGCGGPDDQEPALAVQDGWPVPVEGSRAALRLTLDVEGSLPISRREEIRSARVRTWVSVLAATRQGDDGIVLLRQQGRIDATAEVQADGSSSAKPLPVDRELTVLVFGTGGLPGSMVTQAVDQLPEERKGGKASWALLGFLPPPPREAEVAAGLAWTADAELPLFAARSQRARFEIEAVEAESIRVRATWLGAELAPGWTAPETELVVDVSRRDGLAQGATLTAELASEEVPGEGHPVAIRVHGVLERVPFVVPPSLPVEVLFAAMGLDDPDAGARAAAAKQLGAAWPHGGRCATALLAALDDEDVRVREAAATALRSLAEHGVPTLLAFLGDTADGYRAGYQQTMSMVCSLGARIGPMDMAATGTESPPAGAVGTIAVPSTPLDAETSLLAVWMLEGLAGAPAELGPEGWAWRNVELGTTAAALLALGSLPPDAARAPPPGVVALLEDASVETRLAGVGVLARLGAGTSDVVEALRARLDDEEPLVASCARAALARLGRQPEAAAPQRLALLVERLERVDRAALEYGAADLLEAVDTLAGMGKGAQPAVKALETLARHARFSTPIVHEHAVAALTRIAGPTPERRAALIARLRIRLEELRPRLEDADSLLEALSSAAEHLDEAEAGAVVDLLQGYGGGTAFLRFAPLRRLVLALDARLLRELGTTWIARLEAMPPDATDDLAEVGAGGVSRPLLPGTERFDLVLRLGAKAGQVLAARRDLIRGAGGVGGEAARVRAALERLVRAGDAGTSTEAARALRQLDAQQAPPR